MRARLDDKFRRGVNNKKEKGGKVTGAETVSVRWSARGFYWVSPRSFCTIVNCWKKRSWAESYLQLANSVVELEERKPKVRERGGVVEYQISRNELPSAKSPIVRDLIADCDELSVFRRASTRSMLARNVLRVCARILRLLDLWTLLKSTNRSPLDREIILSSLRAWMIYLRVVII